MRKKKQGFWRSLLRNFFELGGDRYVVRRCSICKNSHHDRRTCPNKKGDAPLFADPAELHDGTLAGAGGSLAGAVQPATLPPSSSQETPPPDGPDPAFCPASRLGLHDFVTTLIPGQCVCGALEPERPFDVALPLEDVEKQADAAIEKHRERVNEIAFGQSPDERKDTNG